MDIRNLRLNLDATPQHLNSPDNSFLSVDTPSNKYFRNDLSHDQMGSELGANDGLLQSPLNAANNRRNSSPKKSRFGRETPKPQQETKESLYKMIHAAAVELPKPGPEQIRVQKISKVGKLSIRLLTKARKNRKKFKTEDLSNTIRQDLTERLKNHKIIQKDLGERVTSMCMSFDGRKVLFATHSVEYIPKVGEAASALESSPQRYSYSPETGQLLDPKFVTDGMNQNFKYPNEDNINGQVADKAPIDTDYVKIKRPAALWRYEIEKGFEEVSILGEKREKEKKITSLVMTRDEKYVVCGWNDGVVKIYNLDEQKEAFNVPVPHKNKITSLVISSDDRFLISGAWKEDEICVFDLQNRLRPPKIIRDNQNKDGLISLVLSANDKVITAGYSDGIIKMFDLDKGGEKSFGFNINQLKKKNDTHFISSLKVTRDGKHIVIGCNDASIRVFNAENGTQVHVFDCIHQKKITSMALSDDDKYLISGSLDGSVNIIDFEKRQLIHSYADAHHKKVKATLITSDKKFIFTGSHDGCFQAINLEEDKLVELIAIKKDHQSQVNTIAISKDDQYLVSGYYDGSIAIHDLTHLRLIDFFPRIHSNSVKCIQITSDNKYIISGSDDCAIKILGIESRLLVFSLDNIHKGWVTGLALTSTDDYLVSASTDKSIKIFKLFNDAREVAPKLIHIYPNAHTKSVTCVAITSNNKYIISGGEDRSIRVFNLFTGEATGKPTREIFAFDDDYQGFLSNKQNALDPVTCLALTSNSKYLICGSSVGSINIIDLEKYECLEKIENAHKETITSIAITKDDKYVVTASFDMSVHLYDLARRRKIYSFENQHPKIISTVAIATKKPWIITGCDDNNIRIFPNLYDASPLTVIESNHIMPLSYFGLFILNTVWETKNVEEQCKILAKYPNLYIYPYGLNLFHIAAIFVPQRKLFEFCIENKIDFSGDSFSMTPFHYMLYSKQVDRNNINYFLENFKSIISNCSDPYKVIASITKELPKIFELSHGHIDNLLEAAVVSPESFNNQEIPQVGKILGGGARKSIPHNSSVFTDDIRDKLIRNEELSNDDDIKDKLMSKEENHALSIYVLLLFADYDLCSQDILELVHALKEVDDEAVFRIKAISIFLGHIWGASKRSLYVILIYTVFMVFLSYYAALRDYEKEKWLEILLLVYAIGLVCYKLPQMAIVGLRYYFSDLWNPVEILVNLTMISTILTTWAHGPGPAVEWLMTITLFLGYAKCVSYFRIIDQTRRLIRIIVEILRDMRSFIAILILAILGFSVIFYQFDDEMLYEDRLLVVYNLLYAIVERKNFDESQTYLLVVVTILLNVVLLNMLIAIMSSTYQRVQGMTVLTDSKEKILLILETITLKSFLRRVKTIFKKPQKQRTQIMSMRT